MTINLGEWNTVRKKVLSWANNGAIKALEKAGKEVAEAYKKQIKTGNNGDGSSMPLVTEHTMKAPIRHGSDPAIRGKVRSSRSPLYARGRAIDSIKSKRRDNVVEIGPSTSHGELIFSYNATKAKTKRDPLIVSDAQADIVKKYIEDGLDKIIKGL